MDLLHFLKHNRENTRTSSRSTSDISGYGIHVPDPKVPRGMKLCTHLDVSENTRRKLQKLLVDNWTLRPESLVEEFVEIVGMTIDVFPAEITQLVISRYKRTPRPDMVIKKVSRMYINYEMNRWKQTVELNQCVGRRHYYIRIQTCRDSRVCSKCASHSEVIYHVDDAPEIPVCWDCRCYYEVLIDIDTVDWPSPVFKNGNIEKMTKRQFMRFSGMKPIF